MKFRQFLKEYGGNLNVGSYGANARFGFWQLPSMNMHAIGLDRMPQGGFQNFAHLSQWRQNTAKFNDPDYLMVRTLELLSTLAEAVVTAVDDRKRAGGASTHNHYQSADYDKNAKIITGLMYNDITGSAHPRLHPDDLTRGVEHKILIPNGSGGYDMSVAQLEKKIMEFQQRISSKEHGFQVGAHQAGQLDAALQHAFAPGAVQLDRSADTFKS